MEKGFSVMKHVVILFVVCAAMVGVAHANHDDHRVSFGFFYSSLAPHGEWIEADPGYYVWRPFHARAGWRPYLHGRWMWTSYGWYWVSYEPYGWIVFHYGRWYHDDFYGWVWVPDYVWGPAWVEWRYNDDYIGWAPLPPYATFSVSVGIRFTRMWAAPIHYWTFVPCRYIVHHRVVDYTVPPERTQRLFGTTRTSARYGVDNGRVINRGVDVRFVERRAGTRIERVDIVETEERGVERVARQNGRERIEVYRPHREDVERTTPDRIEARRPERRFSIEREGVGQEREGRRIERRSPAVREESRGRREPDVRRAPVERRQPEPRRRESSTREDDRTSPKRPDRRD